MVPRVGNSSTAPRVAVACAILALLAGCGTGAHGGLSSRASADADPPPTRAIPTACAATVLGALGDIAQRVYHEGVSSERTVSATALVEHSAPLRAALERDDPQAASAAAQGLIATGHMTSLRVYRGAQVLVDAGTTAALAPLHGSILGAGGAPLATFAASVWADSGFLAETDGITQGLTALRAGGQSIAGSQALPSGEPATPRGTLTVRGVAYAYTSFPAAAYPDGRPLRVYVLRSNRSIAPLCAASAGATLVNTVRRVAQLIYTSEGGQRALIQVRRAQQDQALLRAVAARAPEATRLAISSLLNQHIVRMRVSVGGRLLSDVGGPYVLAPVRAPLRLHGRQIGAMVLSIQDDEGYKRLAQRLAGLRVLMYMGSRLVKNSLGPAPGAVPAQGSYSYRGHTYRVFTIHAQAFPSGPLRIVVLAPIPYAQATA